MPAAYGAEHPYAPAPYLGQAEAFAGLGNLEAARLALARARTRVVGGADVPINRQWIERIEARINGPSAR